MNLDDFHFTSHRTLRQMRRISRDFLHRGRSAAQTLRVWDDVRRGEELNIFPYVKDTNTVDYVTFPFSHMLIISVTLTDQEKIH